MKPLNVQYYKFCEGNLVSVKLNKCTLSADPVARMNSLYGLNDKQFTYKMKDHHSCEWQSWPIKMSVITINNYFNIATIRVVNTYFSCMCINCVCCLGTVC